MDLDHTASASGISYEHYVETVLHFLDTGLVELALLERLTESGETRPVRRSAAAIGHGARGLGLYEVAAGADDLVLGVCEGSLGGTIEGIARLRKHLVFMQGAMRKQKIGSHV